MATTTKRLSASSTAERNDNGDGDGDKATPATTTILETGRRRRLSSVTATSLVGEGGPVRRRSSALVATSTAVDAVKYALNNNTVVYDDDDNDESEQKQQVILHQQKQQQQQQQQQRVRRIDRRRRRHRPLGGIGNFLRGIIYEKVDSSVIPSYDEGGFDDHDDDDDDDENNGKMIGIKRSNFPIDDHEGEEQDGIMIIDRSSMAMKYSGHKIRQKKTGEMGKINAGPSPPPSSSTSPYNEEKQDGIEQPHVPHPISFGDYLSVLYKYPMYRMYLLSHLCQHTGNWFVRIASILIVEELADPANKGEVLSHMTLCRLLPNALFAPLGGVLADRYDRRNLMIVLDVLGGFIVLGYLLAIYRHSLSIFYAVTILRSACDATYFPITAGLVPLLVPEPRDLQCAVTMNSWAWSLMAVLGGIIAGSLAASIGLNACYLIDFGTFWLSAVVLYFGVYGSFNVSTTSVQQTTGSETTEETGGLPTDNILIRQVKDSFLAIKELSIYLTTCGFGTMVFLKSSASFIWGIEDIVLPEFATVFNEDGTEDEEVSSMHMGEAFTIVGIGCFVGPALINLITDAHRPYTLQRACLIGVGFLTSGWVFISRANNFNQFLGGTLWRTMGSGIVWVNSTLVLQTLADKEILGRVIALEFTLTQLFEASSAAASGRLDDAGFTKNQLALFGASCGVLMLLFWGSYYALSLGAAKPRFNNNYEPHDPTIKARLDNVDIEMMDATSAAPDADKNEYRRSEKIII